MSKIGGVMRDRDPIDHRSKPKPKEQQEVKPKVPNKILAKILRYAWPVLVKFFPALGAFSAVVYFVLWLLELF
jgi:hypothetical protein